MVYFSVELSYELFDLVFIYIFHVYYTLYNRIQLHYENKYILGNVTVCRWETLDNARCLTIRCIGFAYRDVKNKRVECVELNPSNIHKSE